jgi:hypothetical protein
MTNDRQIERLLDSWFADGPMTAPDRVMDDVAARITRQPQRPAWRLHPWRFPVMSAPLKLALIGAALIAALAAGAIFVGGGGANQGVVALPTPTPVPPTLPDGSLGAGTYTAHPLPGMTWTITVPAGWTGSDDWFVSYDIAPDVHSVSVGGPTENESIPTDSCAAAGTTPAASVDEFVAAVQARKDWTVSAPVDVTVGGYSGTRIDLEVPAGSTCANGGNYMVLAMPSGDGYRADGPDRRFRLWVLDVDGKPVVIFRLTSSESPPARVAEADAIVETSVITP